jgi:two-component system, LytTR family, sensor histidine kinase AlgZ
LLALRAHLDPHFLFNTLNALAEWCRQDPAVAERALLQLSSVLRAVLTGVKAPSWPLEHELELARTVFELHLMRDPKLFELEWSVDEQLAGVHVPPMLLLPLVENAVKHGPSRGHRGALAFVVRRAGDRVHVRVENPGPFRGPRQGSDGLPTLARRLALVYDGRATLGICGDAATTRADLVVPVGVTA